MVLYFQFNKRPLPGYIDRMKIFLSHAAADRELAEKVAKSLATEGIAVWHAGEILPGEDPYRRMSEALESSDAMVVLLTPASVNSSWVRSELEYALSKPRYSRKVFPVLFGLTTQEPLQYPWILNHLRPFEVSATSPDKGIRELATVLKHAY
jgi:hypothetical protein